jgi:predicted metalloprotease with PDZ domain
MRAFFLALLLLPALAASEVRYWLQPEPGNRSVLVQIEVADAKDKESFSIPAWSPGFYFFQNYQEKIYDLRAVAPGGEALPIERTGLRTWTVANPTRMPVRILYRVLGDDPGLGFFGVSVRPDTVFVNGPAAFMYVEGRLREPTRLSIQAPSGWGIATAMDRDEHGFYAEDYDELIDHPLQLGRFEARQFKIGDIPFQVVFVTAAGQRVAADIDAETDRLRRISQTTMDMMREAPFQRYLYIVHLAVGNFSGGLEHRASNVIAVTNRRPLGIDTLAAHEFFHAWNVKQIRPKVLGPFDYSQPARTGNLWFAEGGTDYYAQMLTYQSGLMSRGALFQALGREIATLQRSATRRVKTVEEASREAWEHGGFGVGDLSYYTKGLVITLLLDAQIRGETRGRRSMEDVMRFLYMRHRLPKPGYDEDGILRMINEVAEGDQSPLYRRMVRSTEELPYELLSQIGMRLLVPGQPYLEPAFDLVEDRVTKTDADSDAAGVRTGDQVVRIERGAGGFLGVTLKRGVETHTAKVPSRTFIADRYVLQPDPFASPEAIARREEWLKRPDPLK